MFAYNEEQHLLWAKGQGTGGSMSQMCSKEHYFHDIIPRILYLSPKEFHRLKTIFYYKSPPGMSQLWVKDSEYYNKEFEHCLYISSTLAQGILYSWDIATLTMEEEMLV